MKFEHPSHQQLYDYWSRKKGNRLAPSRADLDPIEFHKLLPGIIMYRVCEAPLDYQLSLMGTEIRDAWGRDLTGMYLREIFVTDEFFQVKNQFDDVVSGFSPRIDRMDAGWLDKDHIRYTRLLLPLSSDGNYVDRLIGSVVFE